MGKNKVLFIENNGMSIDEDIINELTNQKLLITGDSIHPMMINSMNSTFYKYSQPIN